MSTKVRKRAGSITVNTKQSFEDRNHHLTGSFQPQTPLGSGTSTPERGSSPPPKLVRPSILLRWAVEPGSSFKLLLLPIILYANWNFVAPYVEPGAPNPFGGLFFLSGYVPSSQSGDPRYQKSWWDIAFLLYHIVVFSFLRQSLLFYISQPLAKYFGLKRQAKVDRFGEQMYALLYFAASGAWGVRIMCTLPTFWYNTTEFWLGYPHWDMPRELKRYYLMQLSYWMQQLIVLVLGLEKPRKDYYELVAHHLVTLWLVGWSYLVNLTYIGNAVFMSMDIPDTFFAFSKLLNYIQWNTAKVFSFGVFFVIWTYFRHYISIKILWSVWFEEPLVPEWTKQWDWSKDVYLAPWMHNQIFIPLFLLQLLNLFWYYLILKVLVRALTSAEVDDDRSDGEEEEEEEATEAKKD